jgi:2-polyprenyl-6-methoxyphenol hydroxylase-like FAD-dependent oxidoreductase
MGRDRNSPSSSLGVVLIGDAAGHNDPIIGQGLLIPLRDLRLVNEILGEVKAGARARLQALCGRRARRLRITAQVATTLRVEFGQEARERRGRVGKRMAAGQLAPLPTSLVGPERLPAEAFLPETIEKLLAS